MTDSKPFIIIFDQDSIRREYVLETLNSRGLSIESCYSKEKLTLFLSKHPSRGGILLIPQNVEKDDLKKLGLILMSYSIDIHKGSETDLKIKDLMSAINRERALSGRVRNNGNIDLVLIGSSTGGFPVVQDILQQFNTSHLIVVVCQHISTGMSSELASTLVSKMLVPCEVIHESQELIKGRVYLLSGGKDFELSERYGKLYIQKTVDESSYYHPSFNKLTESLLNISSVSSGCIILSGLGSDGSKFLSELNKHEVPIVVQDPSTAVAPGMPNAAIETGVRVQIKKTDGIRDYLRKLAA